MKCSNRHGSVFTFMLVAAATTTAMADPCGMVPPVYVGNDIPVVGAICVGEAALF